MAVRVGNGLADKSRVGAGRWRLSPAFDINPAPDRNSHLETAIVGGGEHDRSNELALEAAPDFEVYEPEARRIAKKMAGQISGQWREALGKVGLAGAQAREYEWALVNDETELALAL